MPTGEASWERVCVGCGIIAEPAKRAAEEKSEDGKDESGSGGNVRVKTVRTPRSPCGLWSAYDPPHLRNPPHRPQSASRSYHRHLPLLRCCSGGCCGALHRLGSITAAAAAAVAAEARHRAVAFDDFICVVGGVLMCLATVAS